MKYLKTYEDLITLNLDNNDLVLLMEYAMSNIKIVLIESLLKNGFDPNYKRWREPLLYRAAVKDEKSIELINLLLKYNANPNELADGGTIITQILQSIIRVTSTLTGAAVRLFAKIDIILLLIRSGADLSQNDHEFFKQLDILRKRRNINKAAEELFNKINQEFPNEYEKYKISLTAKNYNL